MFINRLTILFLVLLIISFSLSVTAQKARLMEKVYAYYSFDGNLVDLGPHQLDGAVLDKKQSTEDRFGNDEAALVFKEKDDSLIIPVNINPDKMPQLTIALWLKVDQSSGLNTVFSNSGGSFARSLIIDGRKNRPFLSVSAGSNQRVYGGISIPLNKWVFTAVSWNSENGKVSLYLADQNRNFSSISTNNINHKNANEFITLAASPVSDDYFQGSMDELMIWDQILTMDEIKELAF